MRRKKSTGTEGENIIQFRLLVADTELVKTVQFVVVRSSFCSSLNLFVGATQESVKRFRFVA
jgi:hypothetical protein